VLDQRPLPLLNFVSRKSTDGLTSIKPRCSLLPCGFVANALPGNAGSWHGRIMVATNQRPINTAELSAEPSQMQRRKKEAAGHVRDPNA
jgi:hypothetical protein